MTVQILESLAPIADRYDGFVLDLWGVVHDGVLALDPACEALMRYREGGGTVFTVRLPRCEEGGDET